MIQAGLNLEHGAADGTQQYFSAVARSVLRLILDCAPEEMRAGMPVEAVFVPASPEITFVKFRLATSSRGG